ncbi:hypothetical protein LTR10_013384 [Elasticomyces elasticus]|uniref:VOC domain-containing protein n=1 Tax=Exophiala sideris TaxID=1016849 RepID=A0ABR0J4Z0_9EURO|nr:hypothetical protein LTR10_013384 [Elasticomyces elasticus]KAK5027386.1 hypothetical protein LTS07_006988 [Exophiala sideris]KAK5034912.1 hypothetical protein LTR13_006094 [Exophiala sideris]KAK5056354.1 hypothetical protein LTR69_007895 [Exophiala sideris]KAK5181157.1 hypothetical protein LTR44_006488 [Eurotiomycetes sp. CCFEE 6388]
MAPSAVHDGAVSSSDALLSKGKRQTPQALCHVVLNTTPEHFQPLIDWYCAVLNAHVTHQDNVLAFLRYDEEHHRIAIIKRGNLAPKPKGVMYAGLDHIAFAYPTLTALAQQYLSLKADRILPLWTVNHGPTTSMYYQDPDGNKVELQVDNFDDPEEANEFMSGVKYDENPMGTDYDADELAQYVLSKALPSGEEGLSASEVKALKTRKDIGVRRNLPEGF